MRSWWRPLSALALVPLGLLLVVYGYSALSNLWADYQDSPFWAYLMFGLPPLLIGLGCMVVSWRLLR